MFFDYPSTALRVVFDPASRLVRGTFGAASSRLRLRFDRASGLVGVQCVALRRPPKNPRSIAKVIPSRGRINVGHCPNTGRNRLGNASVVLLYVRYCMFGKGIPLPFE